jgi:hypothetical protein
MYITCTTRVQHSSHMGWAPRTVGSTPCERSVVHMLYMWCTGITSPFSPPPLFFFFFFYFGFIFIFIFISFNLITVLYLPTRFEMSFYPSIYIYWKKKLENNKLTHVWVWVSLLFCFFSKLFISWVIIVWEMRIL